VEPECLQSLLLDFFGMFSSRKTDVLLFHLFINF